MMPNRKRTDDDGRLMSVEQPRHPGVRTRGRKRVLPVDKKPYKDMTPTERWWDRRDRLFRVLPTRLSLLDAPFHNLLKVADRERYEITDEEVDLIVARVNAWAEAVEESFRSRQELQPAELPVVALDHDLAPPPVLDPEAAAIIPW